MSVETTIGVERYRLTKRGDWWYAAVRVGPTWRALNERARTRSELVDLLGQQAARA